MSGTITGELRELLADINWTEIIDHMRLNCGSIVDGDWLDSWHAAADHACDAIDAVHANLERENESLRRELDRVLGEQEDRDGWVELPKDADGEVIHIGDVMEWPNDGKTFEVAGIGDGWTLFYVENGLAEWTHAENKRHHAPDTWERIIEDALGAQWSAPGERSADFDALVARCRALAGDAS